MTFLSISPDALDASYAGPASAALQRPRTSFLAQAVAAMIVMGSLTVPGAVAQAKWTKVNLILTFVQHRCQAAFSA